MSSYCVIYNIGRSGSTWVTRRLGGHPDIFDGCECNFFVPDISLPEAAGYMRYNVLDLLIANHIKSPTVPNPIRALEDSDVFAIMGKHVMDIVQAALKREGRKVLVDKSPIYMLCGNAIPLIAQALPEHRCFHLVRDFRAVYASYKRNMPNYWLVEKGAQYFCNVVNEGYARLIETHGDDIFTIRYEDLTDDPQRWFASMIGYIFDGMESDYSIEKIAGNDPGYISSISWHEELSSKDIRIIESSLGHLFEKYGYMRSTTRG